MADLDTRTYMACSQEILAMHQYSYISVAPLWGKYQRGVIAAYQQRREKPNLTDLPAALDIVEILLLLDIIE